MNNQTLDATSAQTFDTASAQTSDEGIAVTRCDNKMIELERQFPSWFELFEDTEPDNALRFEVVELMASAPNDFALGLMYGKFTMRLEMESVTGRAFS